MKEIKLTICIDGWKPEHREAIVNAIKGFVKSLSVRFGFHVEFKEG